MTPSEQARELLRIQRDHCGRWDDDEQLRAGDILEAALTAQREAEQRAERAERERDTAKSALVAAGRTIDALRLDAAYAAAAIREKQALIDRHASAEQHGALLGFPVVVSSDVPAGHVALVKSDEDELAGGEPQP